MIAEVIRGVVRAFSARAAPPTACWPAVARERVAEGAADDVLNTAENVALRIPPEPRGSSPAGQRPRGQRVVAGRRERVGSAVAGERVGLRAADDVFDAAKNVSLRVAAAPSPVKRFTFTPAADAE